MASEPRKVVASLQEARAGLRLDPGVPTLLILSDAPVRGLGAPATAPPAPAAVEGELDLQLVRASGAPALWLEVELTLPDGSKIAGKTDAGGHFVAKELPKSGACTLQLPDVDEAAPAAFTPAPGAGRQAYQKDLSLPIGKPAVIELPPRVHRGELTGAHFETDKTFLLDSAMPGIRQLVTIYGSFGAASVLVKIGR